MAQECLLAPGRGSLLEGDEHGFCLQKMHAFVMYLEELSL